MRKVPVFQGWWPEVGRQTGKNYYHGLAAIFPLRNSSSNSGNSGNSGNSDVSEHAEVLMAGKAWSTNEPPTHLHNVSPPQTDAIHPEAMVTLLLVYVCVCV